MKIINIIMIISCIYGLTLIIKGLFEIDTYNRQISLLEDSNEKIATESNIMKDELNAWTQNREGYLRYKLNYIGKDEKFLILDDE